MNKMSIIDGIKTWNNKRVLIVGEASIDKYIMGRANSISPDAPVPNIKIEKSLTYLGGIGRVFKFIKSFGGIPEICTIIGDDYEGDFFLKKVKEFKIDTSGVLMDNTINTPQITRIKARNQHLLRLETDYSKEIPDSTIKQFLEIINTRSKDLDSIIILDYGMGGLFDDVFIHTLLKNLKEKYKDVPIIARPNLSNYYLYENINLIKMNLQKALQILSIDCCTETSVSIVGKKILATTKCNNVMLNDIESNSYLFFKDSERINKITPFFKGPVRSYIAVGSIIMATLGLSFAANISISDSVKIALCAATLAASLPPIEFFKIEKLLTFIRNLK